MGKFRYVAVDMSKVKVTVSFVVNFKPMSRRAINFVELGKLEYMPETNPGDWDRLSGGMIVGMNMYVPQFSTRPVKNTLPGEVDEHLMLEKNWHRSGLLNLSDLFLFLNSPNVITKDKVFLRIREQRELRDVYVKTLGTLGEVTSFKVKYSSIEESEPYEVRRTIDEDFIGGSLAELRITHSISVEERTAAVVYDDVDNVWKPAVMNYLNHKIYGSVGEKRELLLESKLVRFDVFDFVVVEKWVTSEVL